VEFRRLVQELVFGVAAYLGTKPLLILLGPLRIRFARGSRAYAKALGEAALTFGDEQSEPLEKSWRGSLRTLRDAFFMFNVLALFVLALVGGADAFAWLDSRVGFGPANPPVPMRGPPLTYVKPPVDHNSTILVIVLAMGAAVAVGKIPLVRRLCGNLRRYVREHHRRLRAVAAMLVLFYIGVRIGG
jgi:hypothetical protein